MNRTIRLGKDEVSLLDPPNEGVIVDKTGVEWRIARMGTGLIALLRGSGAEREVHPDFVPMGMGMMGFCCWINEQL